MRLVDIVERWMLGSMCVPHPILCPTASSSRPLLTFPPNQICTIMMIVRLSQAPCQSAHHCQCPVEIENGNRDSLPTSTSLVYIYYVSQRSQEYSSMSFLNHISSSLSSFLRFVTGKNHLTVPCVRVPSISHHVKFHYMSI